MGRARHAAVVLGLAAALAAAGCGGDDDDEQPAAAPTETATEQATPAPDLTDTDSKPAIPNPEGDAPSALVKKDIVRGKGKRARKGDGVTVQYVGVSFSSGEEFDASWDRGEPFTFQLGAGEVIPGWDQGVAGMRIGGRRQLTIPPDLAYGEQGAPPAIGPNETLVFVIDLKGIE
jgi:peptidylprolyl isomerase